MKQVVAVAMSGGVDSSVAAAVMKDRGYEVVGIGLRLADDGASSALTRSCCGIAEMDDARRVAEKLGIPFYVLDFRDSFREHVIDYFASSYLRGETPNPCVPCNGKVKFDGLLGTALGFGADSLATGHYAGVEYDVSRKRYVLRKAVDLEKDQSYFLYSLAQGQLARAVFPVCDIEKTETRRIAREIGLGVHDKPESQDICFVGPEGYASFVSAHAGMPSRGGPVLDEAGRVLGRHRGLHHYTVGQRSGLGVSFPEPMYVADIDPERNSVTVVPRGGIRRQERVLLDAMNYVSIGRPREPIAVEAMTRYRKPAVPATLVPIDEKRAFVEFDGAQETTAPGQSVVLYRGDEVLCGGTARREKR